MNAKLRKSLIAGFVAALVSSPGWTAGTGADADTKRTGQSAQTMERGTSGAAGQSGARTSSQNALYSMTPDQIEKMDVVGAAGEEIGDVKEVVRSRTDNSIQVVVGAGGFLGMGERDIAVPLKDLTMVGEKLQLSATKEELKARPEYVKEQYVELEPTDQPISDFAAFEPTPGSERGTMQRSPDTSGSSGGQWKAPSETTDPAQGNRAPTAPTSPGGTER